MDALIDAEFLINRLLEKVREGKEAPDLRRIQQHFGHLKEEITTSRQDRHRLMAENLALKSKIEILEKQLVHKEETSFVTRERPDEYLEHMGAIFVRKPGGHVLETPICPTCRKPLRKVTPDVPYSCSTCKTFALFRPTELNDILLAVKRR